MSSPIDSRDESDPGDEVIRKFRYQHAYGVILSVMMIKKDRPYRAIWCEQHEDLLAERNDDRFDAIQVKTRKAETGTWNISDEAFVKSVTRFIDLNIKFPGQIRRFYFVSNADYSNSDSKKSSHLSPVKLLAAVRSVGTQRELSCDAAKGFAALAKATGRTEDALFLVLKHVELVNGPTESAFEDEICQSHLPSIKECQGLTPKSLARVLNSLVSLMERAADVQCSDPMRHCIGINSSDEDDPVLLGKRILAEDIILTIREACDLGVQYPEELATLHLNPGEATRSVLRKKMERGGLWAQFEAMRRKAITAEYALLEVASRSADGKQKISQVENVVLSECAEASLRVGAEANPLGPPMLINVQDRLKRIAREAPSKVNYQPYEVLVGVAGLLTDACQVWWSEKFELEGDQ
ncbi:MAG: DUF4297 domain-containing protein [Chromatiaceae bacterium]|nr:DUF4297 domain-containing protein [Chromatiaceae bacterium]